VHGQDLAKFVENAVFYHAINDDIFDALERALGPRTQPAGEFAPPPPEGGTPLALHHRCRHGTRGH
jgi:hypothetical protein